MKKIIFFLIFLLAIPFISASVNLVSQYCPTGGNCTFYNVTATYFCLTGDDCITEWLSGSGAGGGKEGVSPWLFNDSNEMWWNETTGNNTYLRIDGNNNMIGNLYPETTLTHDIGSGAYRWNNLYVGDISADNIFAYDMNATTFYGSGAYLTELNVSSDFYLNGTLIDDVFVEKAGDTMTGALSNTDGTYTVIINGTTIASDTAYAPLIKLGVGSIADSSYCVAMGLDAHCHASGGVAIGTMASALGVEGSALMAGSSVGYRSVGLGYASSSSGSYSTSAGWASRASADYSVAIGNQVRASGTSSLAMGDSSRSDGVSSVSIGSSTNATGDYSYAFGRKVTVLGDYSYGFGLNGNSTANNMFSLHNLDLNVSGDINSSNNVCDGFGNCLNSVSGGSGGGTNYSFAIPYLYNTSITGGLKVFVNESALNDTYVNANGGDYVVGNISIDGNLTLTGYLHTGNDDRGHTNLINDAGDVVIGNRLFVQNMGMFFAPAYGPALMAHEYSSSLKLSSLGGTANLTAESQWICDSTNPFNETHKGMFITIIDSTPSFTDATGEVEDFINKTCIRVSFGSAGGDTIVDADDMSYYIYPHPIFAALDNGFISFEVGESPDVEFEIHIDNGTGFHGVVIEDIAGADQHQGLTINQDIKDYDGIIALNIFTDSSTGTNGTHYDQVALEMRAGGINNSDLHFMSFGVVGEGSNNDIDVIHVTGDVDHIIHLGSEDTLTHAYVESANETFNFTTNGAGATMFVNNNEYVYIGSTTNFTTIAFALSTHANKNLNLEYYYCNTTQGYTLLSGVTDTTDGMQLSGILSFVNPTDRGICNVEYDGTAFSDTTNASYIAVKRTYQYNVQTKPVESLVTIAGSNTPMFLQKDMIKLGGSIGGPETCSATFAGGIYYDSSSIELLWCDGTSWQTFAESGDVTSHNALSGLQGGTAAQYYHFTLAQHTQILLLDDWIQYINLTQQADNTTQSNQINTLTNNLQYVNDTQIADNTTQSGQITSIVTKTQSLNLTQQADNSTLKALIDTLNSSKLTATYNIINNPLFSSWAEYDTPIPTGWSDGNAVSTRVTDNNTNDLVGGYAIRVNVTSQWGGLQQQITNHLMSDTTYYITYRYRVIEAGGSPALMVMEYGNDYTEHYSAALTSTDWTIVSGSFTLDSNHGIDQGTEVWVKAATDNHATPTLIADIDWISITDVPVIPNTIPPPSLFSLSSNVQSKFSSSYYELDGNSYMRLQDFGGDDIHWIFQADGNDYIDFDRTENYYAFVIGDSKQMIFNETTTTNNNNLIVNGDLNATGVVCSNSLCITDLQNLLQNINLTQKADNNTLKSYIDSVNTSGNIEGLGFVQGDHSVDTNESIRMGELYPSWSDNHTNWDRTYLNVLENQSIWESDLNNLWSITDSYYIGNFSNHLDLNTTIINSTILKVVNGSSINVTKLYSENINTNIINFTDQAVSTGNISFNNGGSEVQMGVNSTGHFYIRYI